MLRVLSLSPDAWLIDRSHHLYPSGHFFILKFKPLLSFLSLFD